MNTASQLACIGILGSSGLRTAWTSGFVMEQSPNTSSSVTRERCEDLTSDEVRERLMQEIHSEEFNFMTIRKLLCHAMDKQYVELREVSKTVVDYLLSLEEDHETTWYAMLAVRAFGEPEQYFWNWVHTYKFTPRAASYALLVLGSEGVDGLESALEEILYHGNNFNDQVHRGDALLAGSVGSVQLVLNLKKQYLELTEATEKACFLLGHGCTRYDPGQTGTPYSDTGTGCLPPRWARFELNRFGQIEPQAVADAFAELGPRNWQVVRNGHKDASEEDWLRVEKELRAFWYPFLPEVVRALVY